MKRLVKQTQSIVIDTHIPVEWDFVLWPELRAALHTVSGEFDTGAVTEQKRNVIVLDSAIQLQALNTYIKGKTEALIDRVDQGEDAATVKADVPSFKDILESAAIEAMKATAIMDGATEQDDVTDPVPIG